jgi:hypothetical protein
MTEQRLLIAYALFIAGIILWITTGNVVFFILGISMFASQKKGLKI